MRSRMSIIPKLYSHWWNNLDRPSRLLDQNFGRALRPTDIMRDMEEQMHDLERKFASVYYRPWADLMRDGDKGYSIVKADKDKFQVDLDVQQFQPEEVTVKVVDNCIVVEGKHEEKSDEHGYVSRHFVRKYLVPEQCDPEKAMSTLSSDGVLTITAPKKPEALENKREKPIEIQHTGKPALEKEENQPEKQQAALKQ